MRLDSSNQFISETQPRIFFKSLSYLYEVVRRFLDFSQFFDRNFASMWHHLATKRRTVYHLWKGDPFWKRWKPHQNRHINRDAMIVRTMHLVERTARRIGAWQKTPHFRTCSRRALFDLLQTLQGGRARRKGVNHFSIQFIVFPLGGKMLMFGYWVKTIRAGALRSTYR